MQQIVELTVINKALGLPVNLQLSSTLAEINKLVLFR